MNGLGYLPDVPDVRDRLYTLKKEFFGGIEVPKSVDYTKHVDKVRDQSTTSSCVGFAVTNACHIRSNILGYKVPHASPLHAYAVGRANELRTADSPLYDEGSRPRNVMKAVQEWGLCPEEDWPFDVERVNDRPNWLALESGVGHKLEQYRWITSDGEEKWDDMIAAIAAGYPLAFALDVDDVFDGWNESTKAIPAIEPDAEIRGGHMLCAAGYRNGDDPGILIVNSWGHTWGDFGFAFCSKDRIMQNAQAIVAIEVVPQ